MSYITAKETRVEKNWNKRGIAGLRSELLQVVGARTSRGWEDSRMVHEISRCVYSGLPERLWDTAHGYITETCGLIGIDTDEWVGEIMQVRLMEETLREEVGDE